MSSCCILIKLSFTMWTFLIRRVFKWYILLPSRGIFIILVTSSIRCLSYSISELKWLKFPFRHVSISTFNRLFILSSFLFLLNSFLFLLFFSFLCYYLFLFIIYYSLLFHVKCFSFLYKHILTYLYMLFKCFLIKWSTTWWTLL
jgi:hypothetical protein